MHDPKSDKINGDLEAKWADKKSGTTLTQAWTTSNVLRSHVELENHIAKGLKLELISTLIPDKQTKNAVIASTYKQPGLHTRQHLDLFKVSTSAVMIEFPNEVHT
jgi:voltage-dependent anion channel protein 2